MNIKYLLVRDIGNELSFIDEDLPPFRVGAPNSHLILCTIVGNIE
jgi:hypothetical protein